jgi:hypothetical protein
MTDFSWIIQRPVFDTRLDEAKGILETLGDKVTICPSNSFGIDARSFGLGSPGKPCVVMGSLYLCKKILEAREYSDNVTIFYSDKNYHYTETSKFFVDYALNKDYNILPLFEFQKRFEETLKTTKMFIRPNSGLKTFSGSILTPETFQSEFTMLNNWGLCKELVVYSPYKEIESEFRFWIVGNKAKAYSEYKRCLGYEFEPSEPPQEILDLVSKFEFDDEDPALWAPDNSYVLDVCMNEGKAFVVEINALSTSGVYWCDLRVLFTAIKERVVFEDYVVT